MITRNQLFGGGLSLAVVALLQTASIAGPPVAPPIKTVDARGLQSVLASLKGRVVLVNFWAMWCDSCLDEFPYLVKLQKKYGSQGFTVLSINADEVKDRKKALAFVQQQRPTFPIVMRAGGKLEDLPLAIDKGFLGAFPASYLYDPSGKRVGEPLLGVRSYAQFEAAVKPLLARRRAAR
jgi:thiol-disulfide isomerase/thioredoxin